MIEQRRLWGTNALAQAQTKSLLEVILSNFVNAITAILGESVLCDTTPPTRALHLVDTPSNPHAFTFISDVLCLSHGV